MTEPTFEHERLDAYRLSIEYVAFSYKIAKSLGGSNRQVSEDRIEYEYEYRDAEYEYDSAAET